MVLAPRGGVRRVACMLVCVLVGSATAAVADLVVHPDRSPAPCFLTRARGAVYFGIHDELDGGWQVWRTDGTAEGSTMLARDLGSDVGLAAWGAGLAFGTRAGLWVSDGTAAGTRLVTSLPFFPTGIKAVGGLLLFSDGNGQLWQSDGTAAGTAMIADIPPFYVVHDLTPAGITTGRDAFFFRAVDGVIGTELWRSDGTGEGTAPVLDLNPSGGSFPGYFRMVGDRLFFSADGGAGFEPWVTDGTAAGTRSLGDLNRLGSSHPRYFREAGGLVFFVADGGLGDGTELWRTDGTAEGTRRVADINPTGGAFPNALVEMGGILYFRADDGVHGSELWRSDGTAAGTRLVADVNPTGSSFPRALLATGDVVVFVADDGVTGEELWRSDGTAAGTVRLLDLDPAGSSSPNELRAIDDRLLFTADDGTGRQLWAVAGCTGPRDPVPCRAEALPLPEVRRADRGTPFRVRDIRRGAAGSDPYGLTALGRTLLFRATDEEHGAELWRSDGTELGTVLVRDLRPGRESSMPYGFTAAGGVAYFRADDGSHGEELWVTDGTAEGTRLVGDLRPGGWPSWPEAFAAVGAHVFFSADDGTHGRELWTSDGTGTGTRLVRDLAPAGDGDPEELVALGDVLYFTADDGVHGRQLWRSDGSAEGTRQVRSDFGGGSGTPRLLTALGSRLYFRAGLPADRTPLLWRSDGTAAGTEVVTRDLEAPEELVASAGRLFFTARDARGRELRVLEPPGPPRLVRDIAPAGDGTPRRLTDVDGTVFFYASDGVTGWEIWASDGTAAGTRLAVDVDPTNVTQPSFLTKVGERLYFSAHTPSFGRELWTSDGTPEGSGLVRNIHPVRSGYPESLVDVAGTLFFYADDGTSGTELWALTPCGDGVVQPGEACDDGNRVDGDGCSRGCLLETMQPGACSDERRCVAGARMRVLSGRRARVSFVARDAAIVAPEPDDAREDPRVQGMLAIVRSERTGRSLVLALPADGWRLARRRGRLRYRYRAAGAPGCRKAVLDDGLLRVRCLATPEALPIDDAAAQRLELRAILGEARSYCLGFDARAAKARAGAIRLVADAAGAPEACR